MTEYHDQISRLSYAFLPFIVNKSHTRLNFTELACGIVVVLREGGRHRSGGHFRGVINHWGKEAARGEGDSQEDICIFFPHHQGSGS